MKLLYTSLISVFFLLGLGHMGFTFSKFDKIEPNALWFFSASFGVIFCVFLNFVNLKEQTGLVRLLVISTNMLQLLFYFVLVANIHKPTIIVAVVLSFLLVVVSILYRQRTISIQ